MKILFMTAVLLLAFANLSFADAYTDAVAHKARNEKDIEKDSRRKPADIMRFFEIKQGMSVFDVFAGGGYYTELLSYVVGSEGSVTMYNNAPWYNYVEKAVHKRLANNRLPNVRMHTATPESLLGAKAEHDAAIFVLGMHDVYYADEKNNWPAIDKEKFLKGIYSLLKDGAVLGVIDANAPSGTDPEKTGLSEHRVDPAVVIRDFEAAGFTLEAQSYVLANENDDMTTSVFLRENSYKTNRSILKFRK